MKTGLKVMLQHVAIFMSYVLLLIRVANIMQNKMFLKRLEPSEKILRLHGGIKLN